MSNLLTVRLDADLHNKLRLATVTRGTTMAKVVRESLEAWLKSNPATGSAPARKAAKAAKPAAKKAAKPAEKKAAKPAAKKVAKPAKKAAKPAKKGPKSSKVVAKPRATFPKPTAKARTMGGRARR